MFTRGTGLATLGRCSVIFTPGADVSIGLKGPPFFSLSGFKSQMSRWLGPPPIHSTMQLRLAFLSCWAEAWSDEKNWIAGTPSAVEARCPIQCRRVIGENNCVVSDMGSLLLEPVGLVRGPASLAGAAAHEHTRAQ